MKRFQLIFIFAFTACFLHGYELQPSELLQDADHVHRREQAFSEWIELADYQSYFDEHYDDGEYPLYVETNAEGSRRMIWEKRPKGVRVGVKTNRSADAILALHHEKVSQGKVLLCASVAVVDGRELYNLVWVDEDYIKKSRKRLERYGISEAILIE